MERFGGGGKNAGWGVGVGRGSGGGEWGRGNCVDCITLSVGRLRPHCFPEMCSTCHLLPGCVVFVWSAIERHDCDNASCSVRRPEATVIRSLLLQLLSFSKFL